MTIDQPLRRDLDKLARRLNNVDSRVNNIERTPQSRESSQTSTDETDWIALTFATGWSSYADVDPTVQAPRYRMIEDRVYLEGMVLHGTTGTGEIGTLQVGYRPNKNRFVPVRYWNGSAIDVGTLIIGSNGTLTMEQLVNNSTTNLDSIDFSTLA